MAKNPTTPRPKYKPIDTTGPVPERDLIEAHDFVHKTLIEEGGASDMIRILAILSRKYSRTSGKPARLYLRLNALIELMDDPLFKAWNIGQTEDGAVLIDETVMRVAARLPFGDGRTGFDPQLFYEEILRRSKRGVRA